MNWSKINFWILRIYIAIFILVFLFIRLRGCAGERLP
jgi:hypothetical protein